MTAKADKFLVAGDVEPLKRRLSRIPEARGMYVRRWGTNLILGRKVREGPRGGLVDDDRLKLTARGRTDYSLSARTWNGRWERTGFEGPVAALVEIIRDVLAHYLTDETGESAKPATPPLRISARRH